MSYALSFLDKCPIQGSEPAAVALQRSLNLAQRAEDLGYRRYWVAEHHNAPNLASSSPEVLIAFLLARTSRINIGSGGVMLQHYSAYKVAENFNLLSALAPGRVDLGIGKAAGGMPLSTRALQQAHDPERKLSFAAQITELDGFLRQEDVGKSENERPVAFPLPAQPPGRFLLGASAESAALAARLGWSFVYAAHIHGEANAIAEALSAYRKAGGTFALLAVSVITAETDALAQGIGGERRRFRVEVEGAQAMNVSSLDQANEYARQSGKTQYRIEERSPLLIRGTPPIVLAELQQLHEKYDIDEFIIDCPPSNGVRRLKTIELLANGRAAVAA